MGHRNGRRAAAVMVAALAALVLAVGMGGARAHAALRGRPNIVFVLTDDLSTNLVTPRLMPNLWALLQQGTSFSHYFVTDSLCCPSRASIFTGDYPHDTGVFTNSGPDGGYGAFNAHGDERSTLATDLQHAGYVTAMMGKYLNRYRVTDPPAPGWSEWDVADWGYPEFNYSMNEDGRIVRYGGAGGGRDNYLTDVLSSLGDRFVRATVRQHPGRPFFLELATFAPHYPFTPPPKYAHLYPHLRYPKTLAYDAPTVNPPPWLRGAKPLSSTAQAVIRYDYRLRAEDVRSVDDLIGRLEATLRATGQLQDTYFVFSSDNGFHMGEHRLDPGKLTAFDTDIRVPLVVVGPGVPAGRRVDAFSENIDLRPTFDGLAGTTPGEPIDGRSLVPFLLADRTPPADWPKGVLVEHHGPVVSRADPDYQTPAAANPPSYAALRLEHALYVEYADGSRTYYDLSADPFELDNVWAALPASTKAALHRTLAAAEQCHGAAACTAPFLSPP